MKFSIVIPTFNRAKYISQIITDIINQTYTNWELIIIDDGSTDKTKEVVSKFTSNSKIHYFFQVNSERSSARNNGINNATGDFICFVDSDERLNSKFLRYIANAIKKNNENTGVYYYDIGFVFESNHNNLIYTRKGVPIDKKEGIDQLINVVIGVPQLCISRSILKSHKFNKDINVGEDLEFLLRLFNDYNFYYIPGKPLIFEIEHSHRSVQFKNISNLRNIETLKYIFRRPHPGSRISRSIQRNKLSQAYLRGAYHHLLNKKYSKGCFLLFKSIYLNPKKQLKHKLNLIFNVIITPRKINEIIGS